MEEFKELLNEFYNQKNIIYDEEVLKSKLLEIDMNLKKTMTKNENILFSQYVVNLHKLQYLEHLRLIEFIFDQIKTN